MSDIAATTGHNEHDGCVRNATKDVCTQRRLRSSRGASGTWKILVEAVDALNSLSEVLTTDDLAAMITQVSVGREKAADVAQAYLKAKDLI